MLQPQMSLRLFGSFDLRVDHDRVVLPLSVERVVAFVALHDGPATRTNVAGNLWINGPEERAIANLRSALWRLGRPGLVILDTRGNSLALAPNVTVDTRELLRVSRVLIDGKPATNTTDLDRLAATGELLHDWSEDWVLIERERFRQLRLQALERLAIDLARRGQFGRAAEAALAAVASEPLRESAHRSLIWVHLAQGNRSEAIRQFDLYRRLLHEELQIQPSRRMEDLLGGSLPASTLEPMMSPLTT